MTLITAISPTTWSELEDVVAEILRECGMNVKQQANVPIPRGSVDLDVLAEETVDGIRSRIICECKNWRTNVPREKVHAFRTVMDETGANRGYIISRTGFQNGAIAAAVSTHVELLTFEQFQERYFEKWLSKRCWSIENKIGNFNVYYEPLGKPGYHALQNEAEQQRYDVVWQKYAFAGILLAPFSPYARMVSGSSRPLLRLPIDVRVIAPQIEGVHL